MHSPTLSSDVKRLVLLVEDEAIAQITHASILKKLDCAIDLAADGKTALAKADNSHHIIFMDIGLPDMTGMDVIAAIRKRENNSRTPIIALTAYSGEEVNAACMNAGADAVYTKPLNMAGFQEILETFIKM